MRIFNAFFQFIPRLFLSFRQMNESKLRKGTKYVSLKDEDVHTITGALKQFFRELKSELISEEIVKNLPNDLGNFLFNNWINFTSWMKMKTEKENLIDFEWKIPLQRVKQVFQWSEMASVLLTICHERRWNICYNISYGNWNWRISSNRPIKRNLLTLIVCLITALTPIESTIWWMPRICRSSGVLHCLHLPLV